VAGTYQYDDSRRLHVTSAKPGAGSVAFEPLSQELKTHPPSGLTSPFDLWARSAHNRAPRSAHQALTALSVPEPEMALSHLLTIWSTSPGSPPLDSFATSGQDARITESVDHNSSHQAFSHRDRRQSACGPTAHRRSESTPKARGCAL